MLGVYTVAVFLSALLLFGVQPMYTRMVLPRLGGSPSVWSVAMVFFQSMLLAGYAYAHILMSSRNRYVPVAVHLALLIVAALTLPLSIRDLWGEPPMAPLRLSGCLVCSRCRSGCRSLRLLRTIRSCRRGLPRRGTVMRRTLTFCTRRPTSAVFSRCCLIRSCSSRSSPCRRKARFGVSVF